jgi:hypothetical protein
VRIPKPKRVSRERKPIRRTKRPMKKSKNRVPTLERKLWKLFAAYVKARDGNSCISCPADDLVGKNWQAGHMIPSDGRPSVRYDPKNVHSQCGHCNCWLGGNGATYALEVINRYGIEEFNRLHAKAKEFRQWREPELEELIAALTVGGAEYEMLYAEKYGL